MIKPNMIQHDVRPCDTATVHHVRFFVSDIKRAVAELVHQYGFDAVALQIADDSQTVELRQAAVCLLLTQPTDDRHPATQWIQAHGDGVAEIALRTDDVQHAFADATAHGAKPLVAPTESNGQIQATVAAFGDVAHTFVQARHAPTGPPGRIGLRAIDHIAVCVPAGDLEPAVSYYEQAFGFQTVFAERIAVGRQVMHSKVVQNRCGEVTLTLIEPDVTAEPGQIDDFLRDHGGAGVQHLALAVGDIVLGVSALRGGGVEFLKAPRAYYDAVARRLRPAAHSLAELRAYDIMVDEDHDGQLYQIFARSTHPRHTFFFELIQRLGSRSFGTGNIRALYEALEIEQRGLAAS